MFDDTRAASVSLRVFLLATALLIATRPASAGDTLVYIGGASGADNVYVLEPAGEGARRITDNEAESGRRNELGSLSVAPNGTRVAYLFSATVGAELRILGLDGTGALVVKQGPMESSTAPSWSPEGGRLAFLRSEGMFDQQVFIVDAAGGGLTKVTSSPEHKVALLWSPSGERIAYGEKDGWTLKLWTMAPDGSDKQELADNVKDFAWTSRE